MVETELKLHISPAHLQKLKRHPFLRLLSGGRARTQKLYSIYYDTPDLELRQNMMALRLRRVGKQWVQTLKGAGKVSAGLHQRNEWETPVPAEQLDLAALKALGGDLPHGVRSRLQPAFVTDFARTVRQVNFEGAEIELCLDSGEIRAGQASCPISEVELELKSGSPQSLFRLALALLDVVPLTVERTNKAEYGYLLFSAAKPSVNKGKYPTLKKPQPAGSALASLIEACLAHVESNVPGALLKMDEEYLHQVRVGLRRLRVVLAVALRVRADDELSSLREQVTKLGAELGRSREWDVFVTQTLAPICSRLPEHAGLREVLLRSERARAKQHAGMESSLASQDFQRMLLRFGAWMQGERRQDTEELAVGELAIQVLGRRSRQVLKRGSEVKGADPAALHALRIACKKLRYSVEMFGGLFSNAGAKDYAAALAQLQDILGDLNDIAVAHRLLDELGDGALHDALALIRGWMERHYAERIADFGKAWKSFAVQKEFWR